MKFRPLPRNGVKPIVPPIKCQGIKTKLVPFILENICWDGSGRWIEPFLGSGVVLFSIQPEKALVSDTNPHIVNFYRSIADGSLTPSMVREYLTIEGEKLATIGEEHFYEVRHRFNQTANSLDFLFLSRACFNGVMRFNRKGGFNVPFCRKPDRYRPAYITKIVNQVEAVRKVMIGKDWQFRVGDWRDCLKEAAHKDFVYLDPPYIGRHTDYFSQWLEDDAADLAEVSYSLPCGYALSMWKENVYRSNDYLKQWKGVEERISSHFYHVGSSESLRHEMQEALLIRQGHSATLNEKARPALAEQALMFT